METQSNQDLVVDPEKNNKLAHLTQLAPLLLLDKAHHFLFVKDLLNLQPWQNQNKMEDQDIPMEENHQDLARLHSPMELPWSRAVCKLEDSLNV